MGRIFKRPETKIETAQPIELVQEVGEKDNPRFAKQNVIDLVGINLSFGNKKIFDNLNLSFQDIVGNCNIHSIVGASGCGKSTILRLLAGLQKPDSGDIYLYGKKYTDRSTLPMIFQKYSNFPWMTVRENLELPLKLEGKLGPEERKQRVDRILEIIKMKDVAEQWAGNNLSGGMHQRLALGRSIIKESQQIILCDEFTSALDVFTCHEMEDTILDIAYTSDLDVTVLNVTHNISQAAYISDRVVVLQPWPCKVYKVIDIDYGVKHRTPELRNSQQYRDYIAEIEQALAEVNKIKEGN